MSSIAVTYGLRTIKLKVTPGTSTSDIIERASAHFKTDASATALYHNGTELSQSLPFRLLNLPAGAKLTIKESRKSSKPVEINIKIQFINVPNAPGFIIKKFGNQRTLKSVFEEIEKEENIQVLNQGWALKFHSLTKVIDESEINNFTLSQLSIENNGVLRVSLPNSSNLKSGEQTLSSSRVAKHENVIVEPKKEPKHDVFKAEETFPQVEKKKTEISSKAGFSSAEGEDKMDMDIVSDSIKPQPHPETQTPEEAKEIPQHLYVYKPTSSSTIHVPDVEESTYELTVSHARQYQTMLSQKAHETAKDKKLRHLNKRQITNVEVRIRFPDESNIQVNFKPDQTNKELYEFIRGVIVDSKEKFELKVPYPPQTLSDDESQLKTELESRNLLLFQSGRRVGKFLKEEYLAQAKDILEAEDVKLDREQPVLEEEEEVAKSEGIHNGVLPKKKEAKIGGGQKTGGKKIPSWLKLGKK